MAAPALAGVVVVLAVVAGEPGQAVLVHCQGRTGAAGPGALGTALVAMAAGLVGYFAGAVGLVVGAAAAAAALTVVAAAQTGALAVAAQLAGLVSLGVAVAGRRPAAG